MASIQNDDDEEITGINVTPLVDVMLVLLIIFMVTTTYIVNKSIQVSLPQAETAEEVPKTKNLAFVIDKDLNIFLDGKPILYENIDKEIQLIRDKEGKKSLQALISADKATPHGDVIKLIDTVRKNGILDFAINVESQTPNQQEQVDEKKQNL